MSDKAQDKAQESATAPQAPAKVAAGIKPRTLAAIASARLGRPMNDKRVRSVARDTLARFQDEAYTAHLYTPSEAAGLLAVLSNKGRGGAGMSEAEAIEAIGASESGAEAIEAIGASESGAA